MPIIFSLDNEKESLKDIFDVSLFKSFLLFTKGSSKERKLTLRFEYLKEVKEEFFVLASQTI